jgi:group II intron reverse transcriptase/maturase
MGFTSLNHHLDLHWLYEAYQQTRLDGAAGVDGQEGAAYSANLGDNLRSLLERAKSGTYQAPPVRRVYIPKETGGDTRPIGIPTFEDKVLQRAVVMMLEPIYEQDFWPCSYGFRPGRSAHQALEALWQQTMRMDGGWIVEVDIRQFFDTLDRAHLRDLLKCRARDGVVLQLIGKWLNAGVWEDGTRTYPDQGTPQGGVISPLLANIYLHYVLDEWFEQEVRPRLQGRVFLIRYADDFVIGCACEADARRLLDVLPKRFGKYGLTLHPDKTRLVPFGRPCRPSARSSSGPPTRPGTFDFLGFTHYWGRGREGIVLDHERRPVARLGVARRGGEPNAPHLTAPHQPRPPGVAPRSGPRRGRSPGPRLRTRLEVRAAPRGVARRAEPQRAPLPAAARRGRRARPERSPERLHPRQSPPGPAGIVTPLSRADLRRHDWMPWRGRPAADRGSGRTRQTAARTCGRGTSGQHRFHRPSRARPD